jgi:hypothetical protein
MKKLICWIKGHKRGETWYNPWKKYWYIECVRCAYQLNYQSPHARLVGTELKFGFDGD